MRSSCLIAIALAFAGCAKDATVTVIKPHLVPGIPASGTDRLAQQSIPRALKSGRAQPLVALSGLVEAVEISARQLARNPDDADARSDYNFVLGRILGVLREAKLSPWTKPIHLGSRTLVWQPHPRAVWNPALYDLIPCDQLKVGGSDFDVRETKDGLGAPVVAKRSADQLHDLAPTPHFFYAATVVARFEGSRCILAINDPLESETVRLGHHTYPLAADYTAPLAMMLVEMHPERLGLPACCTRPSLPRPRVLHGSNLSTQTRPSSSSFTG